MLIRWKITRNCSFKPEPKPKPPYCDLCEPRRKKLTKQETAKKTWTTQPQQVRRGIGSINPKEAKAMRQTLKGHN